MTTKIDIGQLSFFADLKAVKWLTSALFLALATWVLFSFTACGTRPKSPRCSSAWEMPNGVKCRWKGVQSCANYVFEQCEDGREYRNPDSWKPVEVCE